MGEPVPDRSGINLDGAEQSAKLIGMIAAGESLPETALAK
jgi:hypothetical protein